MTGGTANDPFDVATGAERMVIRTVLRELVDHAGREDPALRDRITASVEAYLARLAPQSDLERDFADKARAFTASFIEAPET